MVDGQEEPQSLFESIMGTQRCSNANNVIKFCDNSRCPKGGWGSGHPWVALWGGWKVTAPMGGPMGWLQGRQRHEWLYGVLVGSGHPWVALWGGCRVRAPMGGPMGWLQGHSTHGWPYGVAVGLTNSWVALWGGYRGTAPMGGPMGWL